MELTWAGVLLLLCILFTLFSSFQMYKKKGQLPLGPAPWPILGNLFQQDILPLNKSYRKLTEKYGPIFTIWIGSKPMVALCGYEVVKDALINQAEEFGGRTNTPFRTRVFQNKAVKNGKMGLPVLECSDFSPGRPEFPLPVDPLGGGKLPWTTKEKTSW